MEREIYLFIQYLHDEKQISHNTEVSYVRDLKKMFWYLEEQGIQNCELITAKELRMYITYLENLGLKPATISRNIASMKTFFHYEKQKGRILHNPAATLKAPHVEKKQPIVLSIEETERLLAQPREDTPKGMRDKAMLELLYTTGIRVTELIILKISDVNLETGIITCTDAPSKRVIPLPETTKVILKRYLEQGRKSLIKDESTQWLFTNCSGKSMSRQGFWKLIKSYGKKAQIDTELTPHILRQSFTERLTS